MTQRKISVGVSWCTRMLLRTKCLANPDSTGLPLVLANNLVTRCSHPDVTWQLAKSQESQRSKDCKEHTRDKISELRGAETWMEGQPTPNTWGCSRTGSGWCQPTPPSSSRLAPVSSLARNWARQQRRRVCYKLQTSLCQTQHAKQRSIFQHHRRTQGQDPRRPQGWRRRHHVETLRYNNLLVSVDLRALLYTYLSITNFLIFFYDLKDAKMKNANNFFLVGGLPSSPSLP